MAAEKSQFKDAMKAVEEGDKTRAREILSQLVKEEPGNARYWLWMSAVVETKRDRVYCLKEAIKIDPSNQMARRGLMIAGELKSEVKGPILPIRDRRDWENDLRREFTIKKAGKPVNTVRMMIYASAAILVVIVAVVAILFWPKRRTYSPNAFRLMGATATASIAPPTNTPRPLYQGPTPTIPAITPLWMFLESTYTPTPLYVDTPHPNLEAFQLGMQAYANQDWSNVIFFMQQVIDIEPDERVLDALYYKGFAHLELGQTKNALDTFNAILKQRPNFAPAYLGRAKVKRVSDPNQWKSAEADLKECIRLDPNLAEAYFELADLYLSRKLTQQALQYTTLGAGLLPDSPLGFYYRAAAQLQQGALSDALDSIQQAYQKDITHIPTYRLMAEIYRAKGDLQSSLEPLEMYTVYERGDGTAWIWLGQAYTYILDYDNAINAFSRALDISKVLYDAYIGRGEAYLAIEQVQLALEDFKTAVRTRPEAFESHHGYGRAYYMSGQFSQAYFEFNKSSAYAKTAEQKALLYYWRAKAAENVGETSTAKKDWVALVALPPDAFPSAWLSEAYQHMTDLGVNISTITPGVKRTPTP